jgi:malonate-semialdehyde dehydrogenase (acetylating)/methylmalonate-semialdehyde dehydrogenase
MRAGQTNRLRNYIDGDWRTSGATESLEVRNPATGEVMGQVPLSPASDVGLAVRAAGDAFHEWRRMPVTDRVQFLFKLKDLLELHFEELSRSITLECGKTLAESRGEMRRAIENVEVACGAPSLMQGDFSEDVASGIDELMIRQPVGVCACICPYNFPAMIPFWFLPYAIACGNTYIVKPSEKVPMTMQRIVELIHHTGIPKGVVNLANGAGETVDAILDHPRIRAVSFVGSTPVAKHVYARAAANGKRAQCQGGAKNPIVVLPDADLETATRIVADSAFGCAGQRCLAASLVVTVSDARRGFTAAIVEAATSRVVGYGLESKVEMGPVITPQSKARIEGLIQKGIDEGATALVDGRNTVIPGFERGNFVRPTVVDDVNPHGEFVRTEVFGPVLGLLHVNTIDEAIAFANSGSYGNMACLFTGSGASARKFRSEVEAGNIGINIGVAAPMAFFPFSGARQSFFGDLHGQGRQAVEFFTQTKVVVERWPKEWKRRF